jgi:hypothetical protein
VRRATSGAISMSVAATNRNRIRACTLPPY